MAWCNPYAEQHRRSNAAALNRERVLRYKKEREFMRCITTDQYELSHLAEVEARLEAEEKAKLLNVPILSLQRLHSQSIEKRTPPPMTTVLCLDANLRCVHPVQGGTTLWAGEADGSIGIRNGGDGSVAYRLAKTEGVFVDVLFRSSANHMWVGMSDGTVRVYDPLVFILLYEAKRHTNAVTAMAETFDGRVVTAAADGRVVKWDSEAHEFELMLDIQPPEDGPHTAVRALACHGHSIFITYESPVVRCIDGESGSETRLLEGHEGTVTALAVLDGVLWTASSDANLGVWSIATGERIATLTHHRTGVTSLAIDAVGHTVWSADDSGLLCVWRCEKASHNFTLLRSFVPDSAGAPVRTLHTYVAVDASKVWSLGSNGQNFVWHSAANRVEHDAKQAVLGMGYVIEQDLKELDRWSGVIANLNDVSANIRTTAAGHLASHIETLHVRTRFFLWRRWVIMRRMKNRYCGIASTLARAAIERIGSRFLLTWLRFRNLSHRRKHLSLFASLSGKAAESNLVVTYLHKLQDMHRLVLAKHHARHRATVMGNGQHNELMGRTFAVWRRFLEKRVHSMHRHRMAEALALTNSRLLLAGSFSSWQGYRGRRRETAQAEQRSLALAAATSRVFLMRFYSLWRRFSRQKKFLRRRDRILHVMRRRLTRTAAASFFWKWRRWLEHRQTQTLLRSLEEVQRGIADEQSTLAAVSNIVCRQQLVGEAERLVAIVRQRIDDKKRRVALIREETQAIEHEAMLKNEAAKQQIARSVAEQVDDLIAVLKAKLINLHHDYALSRKIIERTSSLGPSKIFLEAHAAVKRVVVELTGQSMLGAEDLWPLTDALVKSLPKHQSEVIINAIKTMIVTFDVMSPDERESLHTNNEIAINALWLGQFADVCLVNRQKQLGKAILRVK